MPDYERSFANNDLPFIDRPEPAELKLDGE
jgi:hypothetical protein